MSDDTPEAGERCKVATDDGEAIAIWTGHVWASEDGSKIFESVSSWTEEPTEGELGVTMPDGVTMEEPGVSTIVGVRLDEALGAAGAA